MADIELKDLLIGLTEDAAPDAATDLLMSYDDSTSSLKKVKMVNLPSSGEVTANKDATGGYAGLTLFKINFKNALNTFTSFFTNANTAARTYTFQDRDGTIADNTDLATKQATLVSGTNIKTVNSTSLLGSGDVAVQPLDSDLTTIAGLTATTDSFLQSKASAWAARTIAQVKTDLGLTGTNSGDQTTITGNAGTATALQTGRTINGVTFDGTGNITVPAAAGTLTGATLASGVTASSLTSFGATPALGTSPTMTTPAITGLPTGSGVASAATASTLAARDANGNLTAVNHLEGYTTQATSAGTVTLAVGSNWQQFFTGITAGQIVQMPVATTLVNGQSWWIVNNSTQTITINSSGGNTILVLAASTSAVITCKDTTGGTGTASWSFSYAGVSIASGKILTHNNSLTFTGTDGTTMTFPTTSATLARTDAANTFLGQNTMAAGTTAIAPIILPSGTVLTTPQVGAFEFDGVNHYRTIDVASGRAALPVRQHFRLTSDGSNVTTIGNFFGANSNIVLVASAYYEIEIVCWFTKTTSEALTWTFTNSSAPTSMNIHVEQSPLTGVVTTAAAYLGADIVASTTAAQTYVTGSLTTAVKHFAKFRITLKNGTGTSLKIQATNPAGSITPLLGSYWTCVRLATGNTGTFAA